MYQQPLWPRVRERAAEFDKIRKSDTYLRGLSRGVLSAHLAFIIMSTPYLFDLVGPSLIQMLHDRLVNLPERDKAARDFINEHDRMGRAWARNAAQQARVQRRLELARQRALAKRPRKHLSPTGEASRARRRNQTGVE